MSTLKVNTIQDTTGNDALTIDSSGNVTSSQGFVPSTQLSHRNLIINGAMQEAQRGTSATGQTGSGYTTVDRFRTGINSLGTWTMTQSTDAPNGFSYSFKMNCTTAESTISAADSCRLQYKMEGNDVQHLAYGTSDAKSLTFSCWVKSNKTGDAVFNLINLNSTQDRQSGHLLTINTADTWEYKTITIAGDTSYAIESGNNQELFFDIWLNGGSNYTSGTRNGTYVNQSSTNYYVDGNLGLGGSTSDYFQITGVQLEVGSVATPFEHRSYGEELARCQRYYYQNGNNVWYCYLYRGDNRQLATVHYPTTMRAVPTVTNTWNDDGGVGESAGSPVANENWCRFVSAGANANNIQPSVSDLTFDAEL